MTTKSELAFILDSFSKIYGKQIDAPTTTAYFYALSDFPRFRVLRAFMILAKSAKYFPRPVEVISEIEKDATPMPSLFDEVCHWIMFIRGITDTRELTQIDIQGALKSAGAQ